MNKALFYVFRHGTTQGNKDDIYRGWSNEKFAQLAPQGRDDIREAAIYLKKAGLSFPIILSDDLSRAKESAQISASVLGVKAIEHDKRLRPLNVGDFTGKPKKEHPLDKYTKNRNLKIPGGESMKEFDRRLALVCADICELITKLGKPVLVIGHGSTISFLNNLKGGQEVGYEGLVHPGGVLVFTSEGLFPLTKRKFGDGDKPALADGTVLTGFVTAEENRIPRVCWNCRWVSKSILGQYGCTHPLVQIDPQLQKRKQADGSIAVGDDDCCNEFSNHIKT